jgi:FkbH-like protein
MTQDVVLLGDKTLSLLARSLNAALQAAGSHWQVVDAGYDTWLQAAQDPDSVPVAQRSTVWAFVLSPRVLENVPDIVARIDATLAALAARSAPPTVLFSNVFADPLGAMPLSSNLERQELAASINARLLAFREAHTWFHIVDHVGLALRHGVGALHDARFEATAQLYYSPSGTRLLSEHWLRALRSLERPQKKVCVVDLDNTLWGGILGEDGADALQMADSGAGFAYRRFQRALLQLRSNGVLLTVCSKNNRDEAMAVLESHPDCLLRPKHFAHIEIGWGLKSQAIERTARALSLGLESFVFIDDSAVERAEVAAALPTVEVLPVPDDATQLLAALADYHGFDTLRQTEEDRKRADSYQQEAARTASRSVASSPEEFYRSLELRLGIFSARPEQAARLHQLLLKTNQFNLTAERLPAEEFRALLSDPAHMVLGLRVADRFGDSGITGLVLVDRGSIDTWKVDNFLLSCRVIGRTVENALLSWLIDRATHAGATTLTLRHVTTPRNQVAQSFLQASGGREAQPGVWRFDVRQPEVVPASFVQIDDSQVTP